MVYACCVREFGVVWLLGLVGCLRFRGRLVVCFVRCYLMLLVYGFGLRLLWFV